MEENKKIKQPRSLISNMWLTRVFYDGSFWFVQVVSHSYVAIENSKTGEVIEFPPEFFIQCVLYDVIVLCSKDYEDSEVYPF